MQWVDARLDNFKAYPNAENAATEYAERCKEIVNRTSAAMNKDLRYDMMLLSLKIKFNGVFFHSSPVRLLSTFRSCGLTGCIEERIASDRDPSTRADFNKTVMVAFEELCRIVLAAGGIEGLENKEQRDELLEGAYNELEDLKVFWRYEIFVVVGRR